MITIINQFFHQEGTIFINTSIALNFTVKLTLKE